jgi:hypothetical protein
VKKQTQYANHVKAFAPHQNFGPAISEAVEPRCATFSAIKLPDTTRWSEAASLGKDQKKICPLRRVHRSNCRAQPRFLNDKSAGIILVLQEACGGWLRVLRR